jgi:hypothetical protein
MIPSVLADRQQAFSSGQQAQARANIDAQKSISYSYDNSTITAIDGSAVGNPNSLSSVVHDANLSGSGTTASPLGLASEITLSASGSPYTSEITPYSFQMCQTGSATSYFGLNYFYLRDSAGGESYYYTDKATIADSGTCTLSAMPTAVELFNGNDSNRFASYNLSGTVLSASGTSPTTARLRDTRLSFGESGKPSGYYDRTGLSVGSTADIRTTLSKNLKFDYDVGGNLEYTTYGLHGFSATTYTPTGTNHDTGVIATYGISGVNSFGDNKIWDSWNSSKRAQIGGNGEEYSVLDMYIGYNNGTAELYPAYIGFYNPFDGSAFIYQSSISAWNNKLDSINVGYGLAGDGQNTALSVTGCSGNFLGLHSDYFYELKPYELTFSSFDKDNSRTEAKTVFNEWGMRITAATAEHLVTLQDDGFRMGASASSLTAELNHEHLRMTNSTGYADLTKSSIDAIQAVYNWATSQGMQPI